ncbi:MAG: hypothetical protein U0P81_04785 [Holophagaceae bacterium]
MPLRSLRPRWMTALGAALLLACGGGGSGSGSGGGGSAVSLVLSPTTASLDGGDTAAFTAAVSGASNPGVAWEVLEPGGGSVSPSGLYTAPDADGTFHLKATALAASSAWAQASIQVRRRITVTVSPASPSLQTGASLAFTASVANTSNPAVTWSASAGAITPAGLFTAPATPGTCTVRATSVADPRRSGEAVVTVTAAPQPPAIAFFTATPSTINAGQSSTLAWSVSGATSLSLNQGVGSVTGTTSRAVTPAATTTYTLTATNAAGSTTATATVTVSQLPVIASFTATPSTINAGDTSLLQWSVSGATSLAISGGVGDVTGSTSRNVGPQATTTYTLTASNAAGSATASATVTVNPAPPQVPVIASFTATPASLAPGQSSTLAWSVTGATSLSIDSGVGDVTGASSRAVSPASTTTYTLTATNPAGSATASATVTVDAAPPPPPSAYLLLTTARLQQVRADAAANGIAWTNLRNNVEANLASTDEYDTGAENMAMAYLVSGDPRYAARAYWWAQRAMGQTLRNDSYYFFQAIVRPVAMTLNYCAPALSAAQAQTLKDFLHASCDELWYHNQGSGWGLDDPANNYHLSFLAGTAFSGYALKAAGDVRGQAWLDLVNDKLTRPAGVFAYLDRMSGGDWEEGANYGEGSKMHLSLCLGVLAAGGANHFTRPFFAGAMRYLVYALQPGNAYLYPGGDLARESSMGVSPYTRAYVQPMVLWLPDGPERRLGQWVLNHVEPTYLDSDRSFSDRAGLWRDVAFRMALPETDPAGEPLSYRAAGTEWINARSGWDAAATSLSISGAPRVVQSHQHQDTGHFVMWKKDWLAADASTYSHSGLLWEPQGQNLLKVPGVVMHFEDVPVPGLLRQVDKGDFLYAQVDATGLYQRRNASSQLEPLLNEHTREFVYLRPDTLVVFDRVDAKPAGAGYQWILHLPAAPAQSGARYTLLRNGAGLALQTLFGGAGSVVSDADLEAGTTSFRVAVEGTGAASRYLHLLQVASGAVPAATGQPVSAPGLKGLLWNGTVVAFSDLARGAAPALPLTYVLPDIAVHAHILANFTSGVDVDVVRGASTTTITLRAGTSHLPDANGLLSFSDAAGPAPQPPVISAFGAVPATLVAGQSATLSWTVDGATALSLDPGIGPVAGSSRGVSPAATTTYTLTATNAAGSATATATVTVQPAPAVALPNPVLFVTQVPMDGFGSISMPFANHDGSSNLAPRGGDLWIRYPDGSLRNLTREAGFGMTGLQGDASIAVREPSVHWSGTKAVFAMAVGSTTQQYVWKTQFWQLYEVSGLGQGQPVVITKVPRQPSDANNISPVYGTDDRIIFASDRSRSGEAHLYPQLDEYESTVSLSGLWSLDPSSGDLRLLEHAPSGAFHPFVDAAGRVVFTKWDHLQRDQQADADAEGGGYGSFNYADETAGAARLASRAEVFPEPRDSADPENVANHANGHRFNQFFPWQVNEDGTEEETLNHVGRHEIGGVYVGEPAFNDDPNLGENAPEANHVNRNYLGGDGGIFQLREDPRQPGLFYAANMREFNGGRAGQIVTLTGAPTLNAEQMAVSWITHPDTKNEVPDGQAPPPGATGRYRNPLPMSDGTLVAAHAAETGPDTNLGTRANPNYRYRFRLKTLKPAGGYWMADQPLTPGLTTSVSWFDPDVLVAYSGPLWELDPVEVVARPRPVRRVPALETPEQQVLAEEGVSESALRAWLRSNGLALIISRDVTSRDRGDLQQPFNVRVPGGVSAVPLPGKVYDLQHLQLFQGDQVRGYGGTASPRPGRRVLAQVLHGPASARNPANPGGPAGSVKVAPDGSTAAFVPASRALTWQLTDPSGKAVIRERNWVSFQPGEIRTCASCHGLNTRSQTGGTVPQNKPEALRQLLRHWKTLP